MLTDSSDALERYQRQMIFPGLGEQGQRSLLASTAVVVGCGATGAALANLLARLGVGRLRVIDRDFIELNNLQRQFLFDEDDIAESLPKAEAAARKLRRINSAIEIEGVVADVSPGNVLSLIGDATVVLDGTDNFSTRYLLNDACIRLAKPWVYSGVIASYGMTATFVPDGAAEKLPGERVASGCLRCLLGEMPAPGTTPTCDTAGVIGPAVAMVTSMAATEAMKLMTGRGKLNDGLIHMDVWSHEFVRLGLGGRRPDCIACGLRRFEFLDAELGTASSTLCGRNAVQVSVKSRGRLDLAGLEKRLAPLASQQARNDYLLRSRIDGYEFTIFADNRAIIKGTEDEELARSLYARYIGS
ncbi:MAG: thiazole biosynthesis adenylyltransferase ThiF [Caldilineaceae bacterium]|nr:thiazole biosynthesis adenylyltransferase ThiF [Caldilineaceae bacterium]